MTTVGLREGGTALNIFEGLLKSKQEVSVESISKNIQQMYSEAPLGTPIRRVLPLLADLAELHFDIHFGKERLRRYKNPWKFPMDAFSTSWKNMFVKAAALESKHPESAPGYQAQEFVMVSQIANMKQQEIAEILSHQSPEIKNHVEVLARNVDKLTALYEARGSFPPLLLTAAELRKIIANNP